MLFVLRPYNLAYKYSAIAKKASFLFQPVEDLEVRVVCSSSVKKS